jgi:DNA-binding response OmpR family regulator
MTRMIIVDDEVEIVEFLKEHFERKWNFEVLTATSPKDALKLIQSEKPEVGLLDVRMRSGGSGFDILEKARELGAKTKFIMVTAVEDSKSLERAKTLGASDYLTKPITLERLEAAVKAQLGDQT